MLGVLPARIMLEWNAFVKPIIYVLELILGTVVTFGVADKFLFFGKNDVLVCAMASMASCAVVIAAGSLALIIAVLVLRRRLIAAFDEDEHFDHTAEALACTVLCIIWLTIACILTSKINGGPQGSPRLRGERTVSLAFAWLLWILYSTSALIAWFVPEKDSDNSQARLAKTEHAPTQDSEVFDMSDSFLPKHFPPMSSQHFDIDDEIGLSDLDEGSDRILPCVPGKPTDRSVDTAAESSAKRSSLVRSNARRVSGSDGHEEKVNTTLIEERLSEWDTVLLDWAHADELGRASQLPVTTRRSATFPQP